MEADVIYETDAHDDYDDSDDGYTDDVLPSAELMDELFAENDDDDEFQGFDIY